MPLKDKIADYNKAIEINPELADPCFNRDNAKDVLNDYQEEIADYNKEIEIDPQYLDAYIDRGISK